MRPPGPHGAQLAWIRATIEFRRTSNALLGPPDEQRLLSPLMRACISEPARYAWQRAVERAGYRGVYHPDCSPSVYHVSQHR